jgi:hypothetical protein
MTTHRVTWLSGLPLSKLLLSLLLPLLLLMAQQGALLHEFSHDIAGHSQDEDAGPPCEDCAAFAHIHSASPAGLATPLLLTGLSFASSLPALPATTVAAVPSERNRGPPASL